jgi:mannose/cellobiose epimerase-like protein (N-acyl-D-glucosamine 2-epimerase family)
MPLNNRLLTLTVSAMILTSCQTTFASTDFRKEAGRLTDLTMKTFWDSRAHLFRAPVMSSEAVPSEGATKNGYTLWPSLLGMHALVEGEKKRKGHYKKQIAEVFDGLTQYRDPEKKAYNAWLHFPGNDDKFYDDNAWVMIIFIEAFETTGEKRYLDRAAEVMKWQRSGWSDETGGMRWASNPENAQAEDRTTSATAGSALAAILLAKNGVDKDENLAWAKKLLNWIDTKMVDSDGLVRDGLYAKTWKVMETKWTYNTGVPIRAYVELFKLTKDKEWLSKATKLGDAAIDRTKGLYDGLVTDPEKRYWYDGSYFVHYLVDGLVQLSKATRDRKYVQEAKRNAEFAVKYLKDPIDGLYFRNWRLWMIDEPHFKAWKELTGNDGKLAADHSERSLEPSAEKLPVEERPLVKTLLANGGNARMFWLLSE